MRKTSLLTVTTLFAATFILVTGTVAQDKTPKELEALFAAAITADQQQYVSIRQDIVTNNTAIPFLTDKCSSTDLCSRVLAEAMLTWTTNAGLNARRAVLLSEAVLQTAQHHGGMWLITKLRSDAMLPQNELNDKLAVPFLLETILKGPGALFKDSKGIAGYPVAVWIRSYAAALVGGYDNRDAIAVLSGVLNSKAEEPLRACAATGLRRSKSGEAVEPLVSALSDTNDGVRKSVHFALKELTGQDFGTDQGKYQDWWRENKAQFLKKP